MTMLGYGVFAPMSRDYYVSKGGKFGGEFDNTAADYTYGKTPDDIAYCGPYTVSNLTAENTIVFSANKEYWNAENVTMKTITWLYNDGEDALKAYNDTMSGVLDGAGLNASATEAAKADGVFETLAYVSATDATSFMAFVNVNRAATSNFNDGAVATPKSEEDLTRTGAAMLNQHFRLALAQATDRGTYNAQTVGEELKLTSIINSYTPGTFVYLEEDVTVDINGTATTFAAGTYYGAIMQAQIDADGVNLKVWDPEADGGIGSSTQFEGWYNPDAAVAELATAIEELAAQGIEISAENPIYIDLPYFSGSEAYGNRANAYKQSIETVLGGAVKVNLVECVDSATWYYAGYYCNYGYEGNYDMYDVSGWGPDYGDPQTYLDTFLPDYAGYMVKMIGVF
jgi:peptide/nickel transport system substrate-binding protein/oligopeptide transport system substrate-binding protein